MADANFFTDNTDLVFQLRGGVNWERFVPLWEEGYSLSDGPDSLSEALELYEATTTEVGAYAATEIAPRARQIDEEGVGPGGDNVQQPAGLLKNIEGLRQLGVMAPSLPRALGGGNFPFTAGTALTEIIGRACSSTMILHAFHQGPALMIWRCGSPEQTERWVRPLAAGRLSGSVAMTEPDAGSDLGALSTTAEEEAPGVWRLNGRKQFITNGCGDVSVVLARSEAGSAGLSGLSLFVVPRQVDGVANFQVAAPEKKFVMRGSATCELAFDGARAELLGPRGMGWRQIVSFMNEARVGVAVQGLGLSQAALQRARDYAARRVQLGRPIARHPMVSDLLLDMRAETAALRALIYRCTQLYDRLVGLDRPGAVAAPRERQRLLRELRERTPLVKWFGAERTLWITRSAVQVHGGYGVMQAYEVERLYRDALVLPIYEGTSQIQGLMSLKDQLKWTLARPWRLLGGAVAVQGPPDTLGDALKEMAAEYNRALKYVFGRSPGWGRALVAALRRTPPPADSLELALLHAERLTGMLAYTRAAEALGADAPASQRRRQLAERFVHRSLPLLRMWGEQIRSGDLGALKTEDDAVALGS